jgi:protein-disulfide isomerase
MSEKNGFFDANPRFLFAFGIVAGIAVMAIFGGGFSLPELGGDDKVVYTPPTEEVQDADEPNGVLAPVTEDENILGNIDKAKVVLIEYSDFECPFCERHYPTVNSLLETYGDDIAVVYRHFPLSFHPEALPAALASECAAEQGAFQEFHDALFENQDQLGDDFYEAVADGIGIDVSDFLDCYESQKYLTDVQDDMDTGRDAGVTGTPATFVNGVLVSGAVDVTAFEDLIDEMLAE